MRDGKRRAVAFALCALHAIEAAQLRFDRLAAKHSAMEELEHPGVDPHSQRLLFARPRMTMSHLRRKRSLRSLLLVGLATGCAGVESTSREADAIVEDILGGRSEALNADRRATIEQPKRRPAASVEVAPEKVAPLDTAPLDTAPLDTAPLDTAPLDTAPGSRAVAPQTTRVLSLKEALEIAVQSSRAFIDEKESLYLDALALYGTRHSFGPLLSSTLGYVFSGGDGGDASSSASWSGGVSQKMPWGGDVSASAGLSHAGGPGAEPGAFGTSASIRLTQPLLRGAGRELALEPLTQAERGMMYAIRRFELFRENFSIDVAQRFYGLVQQKRGLENQRRNIEDLVFARRQAEAMLKLGDTSELEVLRARRSALTSQNDQIEAEESLHLALDQFRIFLGLPPGVTVDVRDEAPEFIEVDYEVDSAIEVAFKNRLDVLTEREQLEDSDRALRLAENGIQPDLNLDVSYGIGGSSDPSALHQSPFDGSYSASLSLALPVDRTGERSSLRNAQVAHRRALRAHDQFEQDLVVQIQSKFRELARRTQSLEIQRQLIADQERNVKIAQLRFEQGDFSNRDVVEAQQSLLEARNALIQEQVNYEIGRLELIRDLGILFIDERGMWTE